MTRPPLRWAFAGLNGRPSFSARRNGQRCGFVENVLGALGIPFQSPSPPSHADPGPDLSPRQRDLPAQHSAFRSGP